MDRSTSGRLRGALTAGALAAFLALPPVAAAQSASPLARLRAERNAERDAERALPSPATTASAKPGGGGGGSPDTAPPAPLTSLRVYVTGALQAVEATTATLVAEMTGDDGTTGTARAVEVRFCPVDATGTCAIGEANWASLPGSSFSSVPAPGATVVLPTAGLAEGTEYLLAARVRDEASNRSTLSNVVRVTTADRDDFAPWSTAAPSLVPQAGVGAALAFDAAGPAVAFAPTATELRLTRFDGTTWSTPVQVDAASKLGTHVRLARIESGAGARLALAYGGTDVVRYRESTAGGGWTAPCTIENARNTAFRLGSLAHTGTGALLTYWPPSGFRTSRGTAANCASTAWPKAQFPLANRPAYQAVAVNPADGSLGIAYTVMTAGTGGTRYQVFYAMSANGGATWSAPQPVADRTARTAVGSYALQAEAAGEFLSLAYDATGTPHLAFLGGPWFLETVQIATPIATPIATGWQVVDAAFGFPLEGGLAFHDGALYVAYVGGSGAMVARREPDGTWSRERVAWGDGEVVELAVGPAGPALLFTDPAAGAGLRYATRTAPAARPPAAVLRGPSGGLGLPSLAPNPARGRAALRFTLADAGHATLSVFDTRGREVARLVDLELAAGPHEVALDASRLAPGAYFLRLETASGVATRPLTVVR